MTNLWLVLIALGGALLALLAIRLVVLERRRFRRLVCVGRRAEGEIVSEAVRRIGELPLPIVSFRDDEGVVRQFRSRYPRRTKGFIHPEKVEVAYSSEPFVDAEIVSTLHMQRFVFRVTISGFLFLVCALFFGFMSFL